MMRFSFVAGDIVSIGCRTKHISTVDKADAYASMYLVSVSPSYNHLFFCI